MRRSVIIARVRHCRQTVSPTEQLAARGVDSTHDWIRRAGQAITARPLRRRWRDHARALAAERRARRWTRPACPRQDRPDRARDRDSRPDLSGQLATLRSEPQLGIDDCIAFDVAAVCTGFLYALSVADNMLKGGMAEYALVIGSETFSRILDFEDRATCVLFGDGAGALLLKAEEAGDRGILATKLHADGRHNDLLYVDGGVSTTGTVGKLRMRGKEVFRHAVVNLADVLQEVLVASGHQVGEVDWVVPHQANKRILDATAKKLGLDPNRVVVTVDQHANTSAASVPLAFDTAVRDGRIKPNDLIVLEAMGGGFTWGAAVLRY
jgi:3-oxoacyl-[acyl-carrier-protein] synthase-3